jgi:DNA-binding response OmpR family regulator
MRILLVEDDAEMCSMLTGVLGGAGFETDLAMDGQTALSKALGRSYAAIVLDIMIPGMDGLRVCGELRKRRSATPVLMITARDRVSDRVHGLEIGADDYLPKPFDVREFIARLHALTRRDRVLKSRNLRVGDLLVDTRTRQVRAGGTELRLTRLEYGILEILAGNVDRVVFRDTLLDLVWQDREPGSNKLDVVVRSLRKKLADVGLSTIVETIYGQGYRITAP